MIILLLLLLLKQSLCTEAFLNGGVLHSFVFAPHPTKSSSGGMKSVREADMVDLTGEEKQIPRSLTKKVGPIMNNAVKNSYASLSVQECKVTLVELISRLEGETEQLKQIEALISTLEERHTPILTLDFFNMAMGGMWKFIFSSEIYLRPFPRFFRLGDVAQTIQLQGSRGNVTNTFCWEITQDNSCKCSGTFSVECSCQINEGSRLFLNVKDRVLKVASRTLPEDVHGLVNKLQLSIAEEFFDPCHLGVDTTFLDADMRIVRYTGSKRLEGVRNIFIRSHSSPGV